MLGSAYHWVHWLLVVYFVSQCIHWATPTSARFLFKKSFLWRPVFDQITCNFFQFVIRCHQHTCSWCVILTRVHRRTASNSQYTLPPKSSLQESAGGKSQLYSKQSSNEPFPKNFPTTGGYFECYMYCVTSLGWLKKRRKKERKRERRWMILAFDHFRFATLK